MPLTTPHTNDSTHSGIKKFCPFLSQTFPLGYTLSKNAEGGTGNAIDNSREKESLDYQLPKDRRETQINKCPSDLHFEYDVHVVTWLNSDMFNMTHMYHSCLRENCMMWDTGGQICRMGTRSRSSTPSLAIQEYLNKKDLDGNGEIYGVDFVCGDDAPPLVANFTKSLNVENIPVKSWADYEDTMQQTDNDAYYNEDNPNYPKWHDENGDHHRNCGPSDSHLHNHTEEGSDN